MVTFLQTINVPKKAKHKMPRALLYIEHTSLKYTPIEMYVKMLTSRPKKWCRQFKEEAHVSFSWEGDLCHVVQRFECSAKESGA